MKLLYEIKKYNNQQIKVLTRYHAKGFEVTKVMQKYIDVVKQYRADIFVLDIFGYIIQYFHFDLYICFLAS